MEDKSLEQKLLDEFIRLGWEESPDLTKSFVWQLARISGEHFDTAPCGCRKGKCVGHVDRTIQPSPDTEDKSLERSGERLVRIILEDFHSRLATVIKNTVEHEQKFNDALDILHNDINQLLNDLGKEGEHIYSHQTIRAAVDHRDNQIATLQSQITALREQNMKLSMPSGGAVDEFIQYHHNPIVGQKNKEIDDLQDQLTTIKELLNGASLHPETGVSLVDDVMELVMERDELQSVIDLQHTRTEEAERLWQIANKEPHTKPDLGRLVEWLLLSRDKAILENTRLREALEKINNGVILGCGHGSIAKAALEGGK